MHTRFRSHVLVIDLMPFNGLPVTLHDLPQGLAQSSQAGGEHITRDVLIKTFHDCETALVSAKN